MKPTRKEISLWGLADCVDFLRKKGCDNYLYLLHHKTPLKTCLKAVLAVRKEVKND